MIFLLELVINSGLLIFAISMVVIRRKREKMLKSIKTEFEGIKAEYEEIKSDFDKLKKLEFELYGRNDANKRKKG